MDAKKVYPEWLGQLNKRDEAKRRQHGLLATRDGWYKTIQYKKRYIAKPMPLDDVVGLLDARIAEIKGQIVEKPTRLGAGSTTIKLLAEMYFAHLWQRHTTGTPRKLSRRTYDDYLDTISRFVACVGPERLASAADTDWFTRFSRSMAGKAITTRRRDIIYITAFFNWAGPGQRSLNFYKAPVSFGPDFVKPSDNDVQQAVEKSSTLYTPEGFGQALLSVRASPVLIAAALVGLNAAYYASDVTELPESAVDLEAGVIEFPRPKNGVKRKTVLMPDTIRALRAYLQVRPEREAGCTTFFVREDGRAFNNRKAAGEGVRSSHGNSLGIYWRTITGLPFKGLRTTFATYGDGFEDQRAVDIVMGHAAKTVREKHYVKRFEVERLRRAVEHVWRQVVYLIPLPAEERLLASELARQAEQRAAALSTAQSQKAEFDIAAVSNQASARRGPRSRRA